MNTTPDQAVDHLLKIGLKNLWYPICPASFIKETPVAMRRLGHKIVLWRDTKGVVHALLDRCPHRGAPLSQGMVLGDRISCPYHGIEVRSDGVVTRVPGSPGCSLEGAKAGRRFHVREASDTIFLYNDAIPVDAPPELVLPEELADQETYSSFLCYNEWKSDYRYVLENVMDPMHGAFLHKQSHSMAEGEIQAKFSIRQTDIGFVFEKDGQRDVNFDWTEWADTGVHWTRLEIPYPKTGGPGGNFIIVGCVTPIDDLMCSVFFWRIRRLPKGWKRDTWRFLYRNRLEARHWQVLEQDRVLLEDMEQDARDYENLYQHDLGIVRLRRHLRSLAQGQVEASI